MCLAGQALPKIALEFFTATPNLSSLPHSFLHLSHPRVTERPDWTILGRINSCMETILFREKFTDWPDKSRLIGSMVGAAAGKKEVS